DREFYILDGLGALLNKSLLRQWEEEHGSQRFSMLETIREYALDRLEKNGELPALRREHALYFIRLAQEAEPELRGPRQEEWLERLDAGLDNLRAAMAWVQEQGDMEAAGRMGTSLLHFILNYGYFAEGRGWLAPPLQSSGLPPDLRARVLNAAGILAHF